MINHLCTSKTRKIQLNLFNEKLKPNSWIVLGFISATFLDFDAEIWSIKLTNEQMDSVFKEWDKVSHYL